MKKLSTYQIIMGILFVIAAGYIVGWVLMELPDIENGPAFANATGEWDPNMTKWVHEKPQFLTVSKYLSGVLLVFGLITLATGIFQSREKPGNPARLAAFQILTGSLGVITAFIVLLAIHPAQFILTSPEGVKFLGMTATMWNKTHAIMAFAAIIIGLGVAGIGIAQHVIAGRIPRPAGKSRK
ncbi:MAG: hypothetical protein MUO19_01395 [Dehalococcoidales bacterium]|nr:hypothetical protein [Dehalococcoidales bacterium]